MLPCSLSRPAVRSRAPRAQPPLSRSHSHPLSPRSLHPVGPRPHGVRCCALSSRCCCCCSPCTVRGWQRHQQAAACNRLSAAVALHRRCVVAATPQHRNASSLLQCCNAATLLPRCNASPPLCRRSVPPMPSPPMLSPVSSAADALSPKLQHLTSRIQPCLSSASPS